MTLEQLFEISIPETFVFVAASPSAQPTRLRPAPKGDKQPAPSAQELVDLVGWDEV